jgi:hypothetical protein
VTRAGWFVVGAIVGAGAVTLAPLAFPRPNVDVQAAKDSAVAARAEADSSKAVAQSLVDSLTRMHAQVNALLARPPRVVPGPTATTVVIAPADSGDTTRTVTVPAEVVAELAAVQSTNRSLIVERDLAMLTLAKLGAAAVDDSVADAKAAAATLIEVADLQRQVRDARRSARIWKIAGVGVAVLVTVRVVSDALKPTP